MLETLNIGLVLLRPNTRTLLPDSLIYWGCPAAGAQPSRLKGNLWEEIPAPGKKFVGQGISQLAGKKHGEEGMTF
jgi:hypothetical protein